MLSRLASSTRGLCISRRHIVSVARASHRVLSTRLPSPSSLVGKAIFAAAPSPFASISSRLFASQVGGSGYVQQGSVNEDYRVLMMGCGAVAQCTLPLMSKVLSKFSYDRLTIIDQLDQSKCPDVLDVVKKGAKFHQTQVTRATYKKILKQYLRPGDYLLDLSYSIGGIDIQDWCQANNVLYLNTALEMWADQDPEDEMPGRPNDWLNHISREPTSNVALEKMYHRTLYARQYNLRSRHYSRAGPTACLDHGMNPGLISHFTKQGLQDVAEDTIHRIPKQHLKHENVVALEKAMADDKHALIGHLLGLRVVQCSERDTQLPKQPKKTNQFINTWSVAGFCEEGCDPVQVGWGSHEVAFPNGTVFPKEGLRHVAFLKCRGMNLVLRSWVPYGENPEDGEIAGFCIPHSEASTIAEYLTHCTSPGIGGLQQFVANRPSVYYVYMCPDSAVASLLELKARNYKMQDYTRVLPGHEILSGLDIVGAFLLFARDPLIHLVSPPIDNTKPAPPPFCWWTGSILSVEEAMGLVNKNHNATTLQVAAGVLGAMKWALKHPNKGLVWPESIPTKEVLKVAKPFLGKFVSARAPWKSAPPGLLFEDFIIST